jgi:hypothetical protein
VSKILLGAMFFLVPNSSSAEKLNLSNRGGLSPSADLVLAHQSGASDFDPADISVHDSAWGASLPNPIQPEMKVVTTPYSVELMQDGRSLTSETIFHAWLSAVDRNNPSAIINTMTNRIQAAIATGGNLEPSRLYVGKFHRYAQWNPSAQDLNYVTNLITGFGGITPGKFFYVNFPGVTNSLPSGRNYGFVDVSSAFTNQLFAIGNRTVSTNDLSLKQVSGLEYVLIYGTNSNGSAQIVNSTNLVYTPNSSFVGTNDVGVQLNWVDGGVTNNLGSINYQFAVTNQNTSPVAQDSSASGNKVDSLSGSFPVSDADGDALQVFLASPPAFGTLTITNGTNWIYSPQGFAGTNSVPFYAEDPSGARSGTNTLQLITTNRPPVAGAQSVTNLAESATPLVLSSSDPDADALAYQVSGLPLHGALTGAGSNVVYTSANNYYGPDSFGFVVSDGSATSAVATVSLTVQPLNRVPVVSGIARAGTNVDVSAQVQPNRTTLPQTANPLGGGWSDLSGLAQSMPWSTNWYVPAVFTIPLGTNGQGFYRLKSGTE